MSRVILKEGANTSLETAVQLAASHLGADSLNLDEKHFEGFGSSVYFVQDRPVVVKIPKIGEHKPAKNAILGLSHAGDTNIQKGWLLDGENKVIGDFVPREDGVVERVELLTDVADRVTSIVLLLAKLPDGNEMLEAEAQMDQTKKVRVYREVGEKLAAMHKIKPREDEVKEWKLKAVSAITTADERMKTILKIALSMDSESKWISQEQRIQILRESGNVSRKQWASDSEVVSIHGDCWEGNWRIKSENGVEIFDPALAYGFSGMDTGFALGKQMIGWLRTRSDENKERIDAFWLGYGEELSQEARKNMWLPVAFKLIVGAAFDGYPEDDRARLVKTAIKLLEHGARTDDEFSLDVLTKIWDSFSS